MAFYRQLSNGLNIWKENPSRKPLVLRGARQVGKTTLVKKFAESYTYRILLNLEKKADKAFFDDFDDLKVIIETIFLSKNIPFSNFKDTLLFIDEIQESPKAIQLLRYFYEELPGLHVIAAGSLLEFATRKVESYPVGRVTFMYLHPLNFFEYLLAIQHKTAADELKKIPIRPVAHKTLLELFNRYVIIGGMPEVVKTYLNNNNIIDLPTIYESIWETYKKDVEKYSDSTATRKVIRHIMATAHLYVDQRIKFQNFGNSNYRSREIGEALRNLDDARLIRLIYPTTEMEPPIKPDLKKSPRLQFLDTGLVNYTLGIQAQLLSLSDFSKAFKGAIIPHLVNQELLSLNELTDVKTNFWVREKKQSNSEVDLVIPYKGQLIPVEIKSGKPGSLKSLHQFVERSPHTYAVRICADTFSVQQVKTPGGVPYILMNLPYYLGTQLPKYIEYFVENYSHITKTND